MSWMRTKDYNTPTTSRPNQQSCLFRPPTLSSPKMLTRPNNYSYKLLIAVCSLKTQMNKWLNGSKYPAAISLSCTEALTKKNQNPCTLLIRNAGTIGKILSFSSTTSSPGSLSLMTTRKVVLIKMFYSTYQKLI